MRTEEAYHAPPLGAGIPCSLRAAARLLKLVVPPPCNSLIVGITSAARLRARSVTSRAEACRPMARMASVRLSLPRELFRKILRLIDGLRPAPLPP